MLIPCRIVSPGHDSILDWDSGHVSSFDIDTVKVSRWIIVIHVKI